MKSIFKFWILAIGLLGVSACSLFELEENLDNPNNPTLDALDVNILMNKVMLDFGDMFSLASEPGMELTRMLAMTGGDVYERAYQPQDFNALWERAYQDVLAQIQTLLNETDAVGLTAHSGVGRVMKAYTLLTLVDVFGNVPYSEAVRGDQQIFNPRADEGSMIYDVALATLDTAITLLDQTPQIGIERDVYYGGNRARWSALANTLKLKALMNLRLVDRARAQTQINTLLTANLIDDVAEEFTYKYGTADVPIRSRHPLYRRWYQPVAGGADGYINNYFLMSAYNDKGTEDPRWRYYFYRQVGSIDKALEDDPDSVPCIITPRPSHYAFDAAWCSFDPGFFGRDHGNNDGIPPDGRAITAPGVYPMGGRADTNTSPTFQGVTRQGQGANGAGIEPIWMHFFTDFVKAEAALTLGSNGDPKELMLSGVTKSIDRTISFGLSKGQVVPANLVASKDDYLRRIGELYDAAANDDERLNVIMTEYYIALWGNGIESYNMYRRTGKPDDIQPARVSDPGNFLRSFIYPAEYVNLNSNAVQKPLGGISKVFWDNNPDNFIN